MTVELVAAAPVAHQVREVVLRIEQVEPGVLKVSAPFGWVGGLARTPRELAQLIGQSFGEAQVAAYMRWRQSSPYMQGAVGTRKRRKFRRDVHNPADWRLDRDGRWVTPGTGRRWHADTQVVQRVRARREQLGLSPDPEVIE